MVKRKRAGLSAEVRSTDPRGRYPPPANSPLSTSVQRPNMTSAPKNRVRIDPVSCQTCRAKKLKCNRVQPCSNCDARGITCTFLVPPRRHQDATISTPSTNELLQRIERLESLVLHANYAHQPLEHAGFSSHGNSQDTSPSSIPSTSVVTVQHEPADYEDSCLLDNVGTREDSLVWFPVALQSKFSILNNTLTHA
jgi:hypothetical protein